MRRTWLRKLVSEEGEIPYQAALEAFAAAGHGKDTTFKSTLKALEKDVHAKRDGFPATVTLTWIGT